jgi:predicted transposase YdaD
MAQGLTGLYPLLPLMRWEGETESAEILEHSQRLILDVIEPLEARADAYVGLRVLSAIKYPSELVKQVLQRRELMLESPVYREILEEGRRAGREEGLERGLEQGREEGLEQGREERLRDDVLAALEVRFGTVPAPLAEQVRRRRGRPELEGLLRRAVVVESLETFARELE